MTGKKNSEREALDRLADSLADDILNMSDEEILAEFRQTEGTPEEHAIRMRALFENSIMVANKQRMAAAKVAVAANRRLSNFTTTPIDIADARRRLRVALERPNASRSLTIAARKEQELSDADIISMIEDLEELGMLSENDDKKS